jgi:hypothetical protein
MVAGHTGTFVLEIAVHFTSVPDAEQNSSNFAGAAGSSVRNCFFLELSTRREVSNFAQCYTPANCIEGHHRQRPCQASVAESSVALPPATGGVANEVFRIHA